MSKVRVLLTVTGHAEVWLDEEAYHTARDLHYAGDSGRLDKLLDRAISNADTEVTVTDPDGTEYDL